MSRVEKSHLGVRHIALERLSSGRQKKRVIFAPHGEKRRSVSTEIPHLWQSVHSGQEYGMRTNGTVKWFNDSKGFGFITPDKGGSDLFAHFSEIRSDGFKTLAENQKVSFETKQGPKGLQAANITPI